MRTSPATDRPRLAKRLHSRNHALDLGSSRFTHLVQAIGQQVRESVVPSPGEGRGVWQGADNDLLGSAFFLRQPAVECGLEPRFRPPALSELPIPAVRLEPLERL